MNAVESFFGREFSKVIGREVAVTMEMVAIDEKSVCKSPKYQRGICVSVLNRMKEDKFNPIATGLLVVNIRSNGRAYLVDGNHRSDLLLACGREQWAAFVLHGLTEREEADIWLDLNKHRSAPKAGETLKAEVVAKNPESILLVNALRSYGFKLPFDNGAPGILMRSVASVKQAHRNGVLGDVLRVISTAWKEYGEDGTRGSILRGLILFLSISESKGKVDLNRLIQVLSDRRDGNPLRILGEAEARTTGRGDVYRGVSVEIRNLYNKGLRGDNRIEHDFVRGVNT